MVLYRDVLLDHLVGDGEQLRRNFKAERFGGLKIDNQVELKAAVMCAVPHGAYRFGGIPSLASPVAARAPRAATSPRRAAVMNSRRFTAQCLPRFGQKG